jgi:enamine deaminase RidA (YjgF/YER057c/UK114 family)
MAQYIQELQNDTRLLPAHRTFYIAEATAREVLLAAQRQASDQYNTASLTNRVTYETAIIAPEETYSNAIATNQNTYFSGALGLMQTLYQTINSAGQQANQAAQTAGSALTSAFASAGETWANDTTDAQKSKADSLSDNAKDAGLAITDAVEAGEQAAVAQSEQHAATDIPVHQSLLDGAMSLAMNFFSSLIGSASVPTSLSNQAATGSAAPTVTPPAPQSDQAVNDGSFLVGYTFVNTDGVVYVKRLQKIIGGTGDTWYFRAISEVNDNLGQATATNTDPQRFWNAFFYGGSPGAPQRTASGYNPNSGPPEPVYQRSWSEYWSEVGQVLYGEAKSVYDTGVGTVQLAARTALDPLGTGIGMAQGTASAIWNYDRTGAAIWDAIDEKSQTYQGQGEIAGHVLQTVFGLGVTRVNGVSWFQTTFGRNRLPPSLKDAIDKTNKLKMQTVRHLGKEGEDAADIVKNTQRIESLSGKAKYRIPDELVDKQYIKEIKNVGRLSFSSQIVDSLHYAIANNIDFILQVRPSTRLSGPLLNAIKHGWIKLEYLP